MRWILLLIAGIFEIVWAISMKYSNGFSETFPTIITVTAYIASAIFLSLALKYLPLGIAYVMWVGFGILGTTFLGILLFNEKLSILQVISMFFVIIGIVGLKLFSEN